MMMRVRFGDMASTLGMFGAALVILSLLFAVSFGYVQRSSTAAELLLRDDLDRAVSAITVAKSVREVHGGVYRALTLRAASGTGDSYAAELAAAYVELRNARAAVEQLRVVVTEAEFAAILRETAQALAEYDEALRWVVSMMEIDFNAAFGFIEPFDAVLDGLADRLERMEATARLVARDRVGKVMTDATWTLGAISVGLGTVALLLSGTAWLVGRRQAGMRLNEERLRELVAKRTIELEAVTAQAEAASAAKSEFLGSLGLELRTPLHALMGIIHLLKHGSPDNTQLRYILAAEEVGGGFLTMLDSLLDIASVEAGVFTVQEQDFDLPLLLTRVLDLFHPELKERQLQAAVIIDPTVPKWVRGDPHRLRQVLVNLVSNATKYTEHGRITLGATCPGPGTLCLRVQDTGPGIPQHQLRSLFQRFKRVEWNGKPRAQGHGLGLFLCARLVEAMGGTIGVESTEGVGSTFTVTVPLRPGVDPKVARSGPQHDTAGRRVLVVEDVPLSAEILATILCSQGHSPVVAGSAADARKAFAERRPFDVAIVDLELPDADGVDLIAELAADHADLRIVAVSAANATRGESARKAGAMAFLSKPLDYTRLAAILSSVGQGVGQGGPHDPVSPGDEDFDPGQIRLWSEAMGADAVRERLARFRSSLGSTIDQLRTAAREGRTIDTAKAAHRAAGLASGFGCLRLTRLCAAIEDGARAGRLDECQPAIDELDSELDRAVERLALAVA